MSKEFQRSMRDAERDARNTLLEKNRNEAKSVTFNSCIVVEQNLEEIIKKVSGEKLVEISAHLDAIYYHIGRINGCL